MDVVRPGNGSHADPGKLYAGDVERPAGDIWDLDEDWDSERERLAVALFGTEPVTREATLDQLLRSREPWLLACGLYVIGKARIGCHRERVLELRRSLDPVVRDTAAWAARRLA